MVGDLFDSPWKILIVAVVILVLESFKGGGDRQGTRTAPLVQAVPQRPPVPVACRPRPAPPRCL